MPEQTLSAKLKADVAQFQRDMKGAAATARETAASLNELQKSGADVGTGTDATRSALAALRTELANVERFIESQQSALAAAGGVTEAYASSVNVATQAGFNRKRQLLGEIDDLVAVSAEEERHIQSMEAAADAATTNAGVLAELERALEEVNDALASNAREYLSSDRQSEQWRQGLAQSTRKLQQERGALQQNIRSLGGAERATGKLSRAILAATARGGSWVTRLRAVAISLVGSGGMAAALAAVVTALVIFGRKMKEVSEQAQRDAAAAQASIDSLLNSVLTFNRTPLRLTIETENLEAGMDLLRGRIANIAQGISELRFLEGGEDLLAAEQKRLAFNQGILNTLQDQLDVANAIAELGKILDVLPTTPVTDGAGGRAGARQRPITEAEIKPQDIIDFRTAARALRNELEQTRLKMLAVKIAGEALGKGLGAPVISFESVADAAKKAKASLGDFTKFATSQADEIEAAVVRLAAAAERISSVVGNAFGQAAFDFLSGPGISDAARALEEFQSGINADALREQFFEGIIGAEEFSLRMAVLIEQQKEFQAQFSPLTRAAQGFFRAFSQGIKQLLAEIVAAIAKTIVFRAILTALGGNPASFVTVLSSILGVPTAGSVGSAGVGALGHLTAGTVAAAALRGPQNVRVELSARQDGMRMQGSQLVIPIVIEAEAIVDAHEAGVYLKRRTGGRL